MSIFEALSSWTSRNDQSAWHCTAIVDHQMQSSNFFFQHSSGFALLWPDLKLAYALLSAWVFIAVSEPVQRPSKAKGFLLILFWLRSQIYIRFKKKKKSMASGYNKWGAEQLFHTHRFCCACSLLLSWASVTVTAGKYMHRFIKRALRHFSFPFWDAA